MFSRSATLIAPCLLCALLVGCGYQFVRPSPTGSRVDVDLSEFTVQGVHRSVVVRLTSRLRHALSTMRGHRYQRGADLRLRTEIDFPTSRPAGFASNGVPAMYTIEVSVELKLERGGQLLWTSGPVEGLEGYLAATSPYESAASRDQAVEQAIVRALDEAIDRLGQRSATARSPS